MTEWYYADRQRRQIGPQPAEEIGRRFRAGEIDAATLVWREGLDSWQPLGSLRAELGLDEAPATLDFRVEPVAPAAIAADPAPAPDGFHAVPAAPPADGGYSPYSAPEAATGAVAAPVHGGAVVQAGLWRRFAASCVDGVVTGLLSYALLIPVMLAFGMSMSSLVESELAGAGMGAGFLLLNYAISFGVPALYFAWMHSSGTQASLGKMAVGAKVVRGNGDPVGFGRAFLRYLAYLLFVVLTCGIGILISGLMVAFTERKQAPHDMLCDTLVVDKWAFTDHPEWQQQGLGTVTVVVLVLFGLFMLALLVLGLALAGMIASMGF
ncbi:MAG: RDD family protein [Xanthomonadales bacterium]|nr:RDD family protein [Xanthomonadaceae bacterium]MBN8225678.1 RDD family protein [Xanthomonadales bacterium]MCA0197557.1 RDD family protein [Pseudomonadota bacterium]